MFTDVLDCLCVCVCLVVCLFRCVGVCVFVGLRVCLLCRVLDCVCVCVFVWFCVCVCVCVVCRLVHVCGCMCLCLLGRVCVGGSFVRLGVSVFVVRCAGVLVVMLWGCSLAYLLVSSNVCVCLYV